MKLIWTIVYNFGTIEIKNGVTAAIDNDGVITFSGTATQQTDFYFGGGNVFSLVDGSYVLNGGGIAGLSPVFYININNTYTGSRDTDASFTKSTDVTPWYFVRCESGQ